jgi:hypothetical protein
MHCCYTRHALLIVCLIAFAPASVPGQTDPPPAPTIAATAVNDGEAIVLDGRLEEEVWRRATPAADFIQVDPANGQPATEPTEVRIVYSSEALYIGVTCYDS